MVDTERDSRLRNGLKAADLDALLAWHTEEIVLTTGKYPHWGLTLCLYPQSGTPVIYTLHNEPDFLLPDYMEIRRYGLPNTPGFSPWDEVKALIRQDAKRLNIEKVGYAGETGKHALPGNAGEYTPLTVPLMQYLLEGLNGQITDLPAKQMLSKTPAEVEKIRVTQKVANIGIERFYEVIKPGITEAEVAGFVEAALQGQTGKNCNLARGWAFINAGPNARYGGTFSRSSGYVLQEGDMVMLEQGTVVDGYWSDLTRTTVVGTPSLKQQELLQVGKDAQQAGIDAVRPGVSHASIDAAARKVMTERGYGAGFHHNTGHHVGFRYHDPGYWVDASSPELLEEGMIITVEPGTYGDYGGCRIEDNVLVTETGHEVLSRL